MNHKSVPNFLEALKNPPKEFSPAAFWFWYGDLRPERMREQIRMMQEQGVHHAFMHARAYLKTQYLSEEWWEAVSACVDEGEKIDFFPWLYDEYAWPSGTAGSTFDYGFQAPSRILAKGPCNMSKSLKCFRYSSGEEFQQNRRKEGDYVSLFCLFGQCGDGWKLMEHAQESEGEVLAFYRMVHEKFVDYLNEETIQEFIESTHEEYKARYGEHFGKRIPGLFFDEIFMINNMPWTDRFPREFQERRGYDLLPRLYALSVDGGEEERKIRRDYFETVAELYEESFFAQVGRWCQENDLTLVGHIEEEMFKHPGRQGHFFDNMRHLTWPGADCHDYRYRFPRKITYREPKFAVSVARTYGKYRAMSEAMGGAGWGCSLQQFKRGVNTLGAMGISMITLHGFYSECENQGEQADWPSSFFFQNPYWPYFKKLADYMNRICYMNAQGEAVVDIGLVYPIEEMQEEAVNGGWTKAGLLLDEAFNEAMNTLIDHQMDVDMIDAHSLLQAEAVDGRLCVGNQKFRVLVCHETWKPAPEIREKLDCFVKGGGRILYYECRETLPHDLPAKVMEILQPDVQVVRGSRDNLQINHRKIEGKEVYFIANSAPKKRTLTLLLREKGGVYKVSPEDGSVTEVSCRVLPEGTEVELSLGEDEACWLVVDSSREACPALQAELKEELAVPGKWGFLPLPENGGGEEKLKRSSSLLEIPLALFSSSLHPVGRKIRIQNRKSEAGFCGRHLSNWCASWITRRPDWIDGSMEGALYCRRTFTLTGKPAHARFCIAAVNEWKLWVNGTFVKESSAGLTPQVVEIGEYLKKGENLIAVQVTNPTPMTSVNYLSVDEMPPETLISLLMQGEIAVNGSVELLCTDDAWEVCNMGEAGWNQLSFTAKARRMDASKSESFGDPMTGTWMYAWERGCPPLQPWGDLPLFGKKTSYPVELCYSVEIPAGCARIFRPVVEGTKQRMTLDGMEISWADDCFRMRPDKQTHQLQIFVTAESHRDGLKENVKVEVAPFLTALGDWRLHGLPWYSGAVRYTNTLELEKKPGRYELLLGEAAFQAEVWVNGQMAGVRVWEPYTLDITEFLKDGENEIAVVVSNSAAVERQFLLVDEGQALGWNRYWNDDNMQREGENLVSGLLGPIQLMRLEE